MKRITSTSSEGIGTVVAELETGANKQEVYNDIKNEIDQIFTFPDEAEEPVIAVQKMTRPAVFLAVYGNAEERVLRRMAEDIRDELLADSEVSEASLVGVRDYEISIEVSEDALRSYGLTFEDVSRAVGRNTLDLPAGTIKSAGGEILVRAKGMRYTGREYEDIPLVMLPDGALVRVGDVATIVDGFVDEDRACLFEGHPAVVLLVRKTESQDVIDVVGATRRFVERKQKELPPGIHLDPFMDQSLPVRDRIQLLTKNGLQGLILVFLSLWLFLRPRLAFWVALGIPISFMGAFIIMQSLGATINMISLFALIMTLGIVVDDAIIVGENIYARFQKGASPFQAAVEGTTEVGWPVTVAIATTVVAFCPLFFVSGVMGKFFAVIPLVVISTLIVSLVEAFLILPAHLSHSLQRSLKSHPNATMAVGWRHRMIDILISRLYLPLLRPAVRWRYVTLALAFACVVLSAGLFAGGRMKFVLFPQIDGDSIGVSVRFPLGTPVEASEAAVRQIQEGLKKVDAQLAGRLPEGVDLIENTTVFVGEIVPFTGRVESASGSHVGQVMVSLIPTQFRQKPEPVSAMEIVNRWRRATGEIAGAERVVFSGIRGPGGSPIEIRLLGHDLEATDKAASELREKLGAYAGVFDIRDDFVPGKWEVKLRARPEARNLGLTLEDIARQVRQGFYGAEALRIQRGRDEIKVMVRYPAESRRSRATLETMRITTPEGAKVPLFDVAEADFDRGYSVIRRADRKRTITVTADMNEKVANAEEVLADLKSGFLDDLADRYPGLTFDFEGQARERAESVGSLGTGFIYALAAIFAILAAQFRSYVQPLIIMAAIPVSLTGVVMGHMLMGMPLTLISVFGAVALAGIVVNDSLVLIDFINRRARGGEDITQAVIEGGKARFRPIILTSMTTVCGLLPILAEKSMQAQFLKPMAVSLAFGLMAATFLTLLVTPSLYLVVEDVKRLLGLDPIGTPEEE